MNCQTIKAKTKESKKGFSKMGAPWGPRLEPGDPKLGKKIILLLSLVFALIVWVRGLLVVVLVLPGVVVEQVEALATPLLVLVLIKQPSPGAPEPPPGPPN